MVFDWSLIIPLSIVDMCVSFGVAYGTYRYVTWRNEQMLRKKHPTKANGLNLDLSYRIDDNEVFGIHCRGVDVIDLINNAMDAFSSVDKHVEK